MTQKEKSHLTAYGRKLQYEHSLKRWYVLALRNYRSTLLSKVYQELNGLGFKTFQPFLMDGKPLTMNAFFVWSSYDELTSGDCPVVGPTGKLGLCFRTDRCATPPRIITLSEDDIVQFKMICTQENTGQILISKAKNDKKRYETLLKQLDKAQPALVTSGTYAGFIGHYGKIDSQHRLAMKLDDYNAIATAAIPQSQAQLLTFDEYVYLSSLKISTRVTALQGLRTENLLDKIVIPEELQEIFKNAESPEDLADKLLPYPARILKNAVAKTAESIEEYATLTHAVAQHFASLPESERDGVADDYLPDVLCSFAYNSFLNPDGTWRIGAQHVQRLNQYLYELSNLWTFSRYRIPRICHQRPFSHSTDFKGILEKAKGKSRRPVENEAKDEAKSTGMPPRQTSLPERFVTELTSPTLIHKYRHAPLARIPSGPAAGVVGRFVEHVDGGKKLNRLFIEHPYNHAWLVTAPRATRLEFLI